MSRGPTGWEGTAFEDVHMILGHAIRAADPAARPAAPFHLGGPRPRPDGRTLMRIGIESATRVRPLIDADHLGDYDAALGCARAFVHADPGSQASIETSRELLEQGWAFRSRRNPFPIPGFVCVAAANLAIRKTDRAVESIKAVAVRVVKALRSREGDTRRYLADLDRWLVHGEAEAVLDRYAPDRAIELDRVLFRHDRGNGVAGHFIVRLRGGSLGLVTKIRGRYRFFEGDRESVLATIADEQVFAAGVEALTTPQPSSRASVASDRPQP